MPIDLEGESAPRLLKVDGETVNRDATEAGAIVKQHDRQLSLSERTRGD